MKKNGAVVVISIQGDKSSKPPLSEYITAYRLSCESSERKNVVNPRELAAKQPQQRVYPQHIHSIAQAVPAPHLSFRVCAMLKLEDGDVDYKYIRVLHSFYLLSFFYTNS